MRRDIQFLRGFAVLAVVLFHSNLALLSQGYLGVDIFFVLSGFLITSIILKGLDDNSFSFSEFYLRRAKRLIPALYSTLFFTTLIGLVALTHQQWLEYLKQLIGALTFTANMVLPMQTGYFESTSEGKPLLHIWSLSLEEQYYFFLPIALFLLSNRFRFPAILLFTFISLFWCLSWVYSENKDVPLLWRLADSSRSEWAFYLLPTRAWELLAGSICAWLMLNRPPIEIPPVFKYIALILIGLSCTVNINNEHPSVEAMIVVLSTMIILIGNKDWLPKGLVVRLFERAGDWSYSLYLVHWPLFAFAYLVYVGDVPVNTKIILIFLSLFLGYLQYRFVETPFRKGKLKKIFATWKTALLATLCFLAVPVIAFYVASDTEDAFSKIRRQNTGLAKACDDSFETDGKLTGACVLGDDPKIVVWGDSYAMHLIPGLAVKNTELIQITKSMCGPMMGIAPIAGSYDSVWAKQCLEFNERAMAYIKSHKNISHVVLSSTLISYLDLKGGAYLTYKGITAANMGLLVESFKNTILALQQLGIATLVISPPPKSGFDIGECLEREYGTALLLRDTCAINYNEYQIHQELVNETLKEIEKVSRVLWLKDYLCEGDLCKVYINNTFMYRDGGHLSIDGSIELLKDLDIVDYLKSPNRLQQ